MSDLDHAQMLTQRPADDWLFAAPRGGAWSPNNWRSRVWSKAVAGTQFERMGLTPHGLRHTAASMAIASGADVKAVQEMLGHASAVEPLDTYADLWPDRLDEVAERMAAERARALAKRENEEPEAEAA